MIAVFDSGVGGLAILRQLTAQLPDHDFLYLADSKAFPYGPRSADQLQARASEITSYLIGRGAGLVVIACNTATVVAVEALRLKFLIPFAGVVPPVKVAASNNNNPILVLLTENTASGEKYTRLVQKYGLGRQVRTLSLPLLAQVVEDCSFRKPDVAQRVKDTLLKNLAPLPEEANLVLGCTHYIFLKDLLRETFGQRIKIFDPSQAVAEQVARLCEEHNLKNSGSGKIQYFCSGNTTKFSNSVAHLLGVDSPLVEKVKLAEIDPAD